MNSSSKLGDGGGPEGRSASVRAYSVETTAELIEAILTTNAGSTGLNLQAANTVINVDLPWNPAVLEQRIARAHRMGQKRHVTVYVLVTEQTLEENLLATLSTKRDLAMAALDPDSKIAEVDVRTQADDIKEQLEVLLGSKPAAPVDLSMKEEAVRAASSERVAQAGSTFLRAAFDLLAQIAGGGVSDVQEGIVRDLRSAFDAKVVADERGIPRISLAVPSRETLEVLFRGVAGLFSGEAKPL